MAGANPVVGALRFTAAPVELADADAPVPVVAALVRVSVAPAVVLAALVLVTALVPGSAPVDLSLVGAPSVGGVMVAPTAKQAAT